MDSEICAEIATSICRAGPSEIPIWLTVTLKRGTLVKKIRLTDDPAEVDCKVNGSEIVLRTEFLKKA